jgi:serine/threonine protein kinase
MTNLVGQTLGQYRIEALLGTGAMGQVFRGTHIYLGQPAAIKVMPAALAANPAFQSRFLQEVKSAAALKHPNIVEIYEVGEQEGYLYLAMELMTDGSLRTLLQRNAGKPLPLSLGLDLVCQAAEGLAAAHAQKVVHGDLKPDTLLLTRQSGSGQGRERYLLKISDFWLARLAAESGLTATDVPWGTPAYMSPEQCQSKPLDGRSDLYSLGVVLYEVATGYLPFQIDNFDDAFTKHVNTPPPSPRQVRPDLPPRLEASILRCLAKRPEERYATGTELASDLQQVLNELPPEEEAVPPPPPPVVGINRIGVAVKPETLTITPGQPATIQVTLFNLGNTVDWFTPTVEGVAPEWVQGQGEAVQLNPGMQQTITLNVNVARTATNRAQVYPVTIRARSQEKPNESNSVHGTWTVQPFKEDVLGLEPRRASGRGSAAYTVSLQNGGNTPAQYELSGEDDEKKLAYRFGQNPVALEPARDARVPLAVSASRHWIGREQRQPFQVHARPAGGSPLTASGEFVNKVLIPTWLLSAVGVVLAIGLVLVLIHPWDGGGGGTQPGTTPSPVVPFSVTGVTVSVDKSNFNGACTDPMIFTFTATIRVPAGTSGGMVAYTWLQSDGGTGSTRTVSFSPGATTQTVTTTWQLGAIWGNGSPFWEALQVTAPNSVTSAHANFSFVCQFRATSISASASPTTYNCHLSRNTFKFSATIAISPGPTGGSITYTWARSGGSTMSPITIAVPAGQKTVTVTTYWILGVHAPRGFYWEQVVVSAPNSITSNRATFTKRC